MCNRQTKKIADAVSGIFQFLFHVIIFTLTLQRGNSVLKQLKLIESIKARFLTLLWKIVQTCYFIICYHITSNSKKQLRGMVRVLVITFLRSILKATMI